MKIKIIMPFKTTLVDEATERTAKEYLSKGTQVRCVHPQEAPEKITCQYDEAFAVVGVLDEAGKAAEEGYDGVLISCFGDPGLKPARELANIPVVGTAESAMLFGAALAQRFSVITIPQSLVCVAEDIAKLSGVYDKLASVRHLGSQAFEMRKEQKVQRTYDEAIRAIEEDGAQALVIGCTGLLDVPAPLQQLLREKKGYDVPVIDPVGAPVKFLESLIALGLSQSKLTYMAPSK